MKKFIIGLLAMASIAANASEWLTDTDGMVYKSSVSESDDSTIGVKLNDNATMGVYFYLNVGDCEEMEGKIVENAFFMNGKDYRAILSCSAGQLSIAPIGRGIHEAVKILYTKPVMIICPSSRCFHPKSFYVRDFRELTLVNSNLK